jgi:uncharacterized membrane protein YhaH (DUF805 family)
MGFGDAIRSAFNKYATFSGRARRSEYWWFVLFCMLGNIAAGILDAAIFGFDAVVEPGMAAYAAPSLIGGLFSLAVFLPSLGVTVRRLHDTNRSGWWILIVLIPLVGFLILLYWMVKPGDAGPNDYGQDPIGTSGGPVYPRP